MHLTLNPQVGLPGQPEMTIHVDGDTITLDGVSCSLALVPEGGEAVLEGWPGGPSPFVGPIRRIDGVIHASIIARLGDTAADDQPADPAHWVIPDATGAVTIPALRRPLEPVPDPDPELAPTEATP